jgi:cytochrome c oxidase subunit 2
MQATSSRLQMRFTFRSASRSLSLCGADVIHSFWVPNLAGKKDLIPGKINTIWLQADKPGVYRGQCAEYCGLQHAQMALWVVAEPQEQFNAWRQNQTQTSVQPASDSQKRGQQVFLSSTCIMCHAVNGTPGRFEHWSKPDARRESQHDRRGDTREYTRSSLRSGSRIRNQIKPGNKMPQNNLSEADLQALVDYLQSLK